MYVTNCALLQAKANETKYTGVSSDDARTGGFRNKPASSAGGGFSSSGFGSGGLGSSRYDDYESDPHIKSDTLQAEAKVKFAPPDACLLLLMPDAFVLNALLRVAMNGNVNTLMQSPKLQLCHDHRACSLPCQLISLMSHLGPSIPSASASA